MKKLLLTAAFAATAMFAANVKGVVSEEHCGAKHSEAGEKAEKCVAGCVKKGAKPVLVSEGKVYKLEDTAKFMDHLGHEVTVNAKVDGDTLTKIKSVKMAKAKAAAGETK